MTAAPPKRRESFTVHSYEVDAFSTIAVPALSGYLREIAGHHAAELGVGLETLRARGLTWVLARQRIENPVPIRLGDTLEIETWPAGVDRLAAHRHFVVRRGGEEVARATTHWFVLDLERRRPVRPGEVLDGRFPRALEPPVVPITSGKLPDLRAWELQKRFHVRYADIDVNLHVTNTSYLTWAQEAAPREVFRGRRLASAEVHFLAEAHYGSAILSRVASSGDGAFAHAIVREEDERELARVATAWVPRERSADSPA
jgi:medium-chain acyl-[acyl-carrier-protein] hydrolase